MTGVRPEFLFAGGNRHPSAGDWYGDYLAFGSGKNIAIWDPRTKRGIQSLLSGHEDTVTAVRFLRVDKDIVLISGSADKTVRIWRITELGSFHESLCLHEHENSINTISVRDGSTTFVTGGADGSVKVWQISLPSDSSTPVVVDLLQSIVLKPRLLPLTTAIVELNGGSTVLAVAGTASSIHIFTDVSGQFKLNAILAGHEGWIRSLAFVRESSSENGDILLASASQDKYIRLWRIHQGTELPSLSAAASDPALGAFGRTLSNKPYFIGDGKDRYSITFEALLIGHDDWIYTVDWQPASSSSYPRLLSASADNSIAVWDKEEESGIWSCTTRLGEISTQKGSTSATGSTGGFWIGLWSPDHQSLASLGATGSWRQWRRSDTTDGPEWTQTIGISGHVKEVRDLAWSSDGSHLLSTGSDQTTRLLSQWEHGGSSDWHEVSRPQIHGYDLNCIDTLGTNRFISGADEKLLRVFDKPRAVANLISKLSGVEDTTAQNLPDAANIPVLGLSNKAVEAIDAEEDAVEASGIQQVKGHDAVDPKSALHKNTLQSDHAPFEDHLARYTLWPEHEKLYGHGYEISAVAASHDTTLVATACKASSLEHAVIRIYETHDWREIKPALQAHSLTVTSLAFSADDKYLLSVGRDRQWTVFARSSQDTDSYELLASNPKGHSRMILDCSWAPSGLGNVFATAGRDKSVKIWADTADGTGFDCMTTISMPNPVTAVSFARSSSTHADLHAKQVLLACGTETGAIRIVSLSGNDWSVLRDLEIKDYDLPSAAVNAISWQPAMGHDLLNGPWSDRSDTWMLAVASDDHSLRLFRVVCMS